MLTGQEQQRDESRAPLAAAQPFPEVCGAAGTPHASLPACRWGRGADRNPPIHAVITGGERSPPPATQFCCFNSAGQREKGQAAKYAAFQGFLCLPPEQRAAPGQALPRWADTRAGPGGADISGQAREMESKSMAMVTDLFFWRTRESRQHIRASRSRCRDSG